MINTFTYILDIYWIWNFYSNFNVQDINPEEILNVLTMYKIRCICNSYIVT
jgi:hypothetical protein